MVRSARAAWWPPKVGDKLRHATLGADDEDRVVQVEALIHVLSVFEHDGKTHAVTAEWFPRRRRWSYQVYGVEAAMVGMIWPDGAPLPGDG